MEILPNSRAFTLFPQLPVELRRAIWEHAANLPRNLDVWALWGGPRYILDTRDEKFELATRQPIPGVLLASKKSREATQKYFELGYGVEIKGRLGGKVVIPPKVPRNLSADTICPMGIYTASSQEALWRDHPTACWAINVAPSHS
ncbi:uncharacterized protein LY89DRAFT_770729 [Mollisia scopiformis]|uniref:2EXR domain-containing protein n=1 Tax=Mollisia scopiformis TaxID=149040 RepID=A0A194XML9_MOLSC|nr:uncharacterized protein LY89DRAFT_770729 [Mollisia scopiformis]KUJ21376.1 hypothetical protein LY89DRAFT_770729 [Mollisia scopiformis]